MTGIERITTAVVGAGIFGARHARALAENPLADLRYVVDLNEELGRRVATQVGATWLSSVDEALADDDVTAFTVAVPDRLHAVAVPLLESGRAVLLEKPMAHDLTTARLLRDAAAKGGARLMVGQLFRFDGRYQSMKQAVDDGALGTFIHGNASRLSFPRVGVRTAGKSSVLWYLGIHEIDAIQWVTGDRIVQVSASAVAKLMPAAGVDAEDAIVALARFESGAVATLTFGWSMADHMPTGLRINMELVGSNGTIELNTEGSGVTVYAPAKTTTPEFIYSAEVDGRLAGSIQAEFDHFLRSVRDGTEFAVPLADAFRNVAVNDAILAAVASGRWEDVEDLG